MTSGAYLDELNEKLHLFEFIKSNIFVQQKKLDTFIVFMSLFSTKDTLIVYNNTIACRSNAIANINNLFLETCTCNPFD